jgi:diketogulonate reductase-like aldo/keto reductase
MGGFMDYQELGTTGVRIPDIGFGTWKYTGGIQPIHRGVELGANLIDTAEGYKNEEAVGLAIAGIRNQVFLATKVSSSHFRKNDLLKAADQSLKRLKIDVIDLYQLHWPNDAIPIAETMGAMESLVDAGKVRFIGVSNFSVSQMQEAQNALSNARIVSNQVRYSLIDRSIESTLIPYCQEQGVTVMAYSPLATGLGKLESKGGAEAINKISTSTGKTHPQVALNWCLRQQRVMVIPKANSLAHVEDDCGASGWRITPDDLAILDAAFPQ